MNALLTTAPAPSANASVNTAPTPISKPSERILSIDVLRGLTMAFMILVNDPGDGRVAYRPLDHADWNGWTPTDLVFPTFLFLIGCSVVFSFRSRLARGVPRATVALQALRRSATIVALYFALRLLPDFKRLDHIRFFGVLPRIALVYLAAALIYLAVSRTRTPTLLIVLTIATLLLGYYALLRFVPIPGAGLPGRDFPFLDEHDNLTAWIDRGFNAWTIRNLRTGYLYVDNYRDPEGWLSTLPAIGTVLLGVLAGKLVRSALPARRVALILLVAGVLGILAGELWNPWFPINKNMWTGSYVLLAAGIAATLLSACYFLFDVLQLQRRSALTRALAFPWIVFGSNAIAAYITADLWGKILDYIHIHDGPRTLNPLGWLYLHVFAHSGSTANTSLAFSLFYVFLCFLPVLILYRRGIFLRV